MKIETQYCDYCHADLTGAIKMGFCVEIGYSRGGWGSRKDLVPKDAVEICMPCYDAVKDKSAELKEVIAGLKLKRRALPCRR